MKQESRERLVGLLWSRSDEEKARASLRQVVRELRSVLEEAGYDGFVAERLMIGIDVGQIEVDIESVIQLAEGGRVHPLLLDTPAAGRAAVRRNGRSRSVVPGLGAGQAADHP